MTPPEAQAFIDHHAPRLKREGECLIWTGQRSTSGYGRVVIGQKLFNAHRILFALIHGPIAPGIDIDHICHNRPCIEPQHLRASSHRDNIRNRRGADRNSRSGVRGVRWREDCKNHWEARLQFEGKEVVLGHFATLEEAGAAAEAGRLRYYGEFAGKG